MSILSIDLQKINLDDTNYDEDDPEIIIHIRLFTLHVKFGLSPLKMKNAFYFILKALFVLKVFKFLSWSFGHEGKTSWLEK